MSSFAPIGLATPVGSRVQPSAVPSTLGTTQVLDDYVLVKKNLMAVPDMKDSAVVKAVGPSKDDDKKTSSERGQVSSRNAGPALALSASMGALKLPNVRVRVPLSLTFSSNGGGVAAGAQSVDPTAVSEASALDTLWSECRCLGGKYCFYPNANSMNAQQIVLAYDPAGSSALSSTVQGAQFAQHELYSLPGLETTAGNAQTVAVLQNAKSLEFSFKVPKGIKEGTTFGADQWSTTGTSTSYGYVKVYAVGVASTPLLQGILYLDLEYRSRQ